MGWPFEELRSGLVLMRGEFLSAVSESFMLSVEVEFVEPLEPLEDAIVIRISCEGRSTLDLGFWIDLDSMVVEFWEKKTSECVLGML